MSKIIKLDKNLSNQISAGEVVERPISIVKELVENSIDANAKNIKIEIIEGGKTLISVSDDGEGIDKEDLDIILEKHSTSKIKTIDDLYSVLTFGFRGEALASISSVSRISITSKTNYSLEGYNLYFDSENGQKISKTSSNTGTSIEVRDLFFNTPARLNYLKKENTEYQKILRYIQEVALSNPTISFRLINNGKETLYFPENDTLSSRIYTIYQDDVSSNLLEVDFSMNGIGVTGYISDPKVTFKNKNKQHIFVNKRPISSIMISKAISDAYNRFIPHGMYPFFVLNLTIDPTQVDVNVHPRKNEVRFASEQSIFRVFYHAILNILEKSSLLKEDNSSIENNNHVASFQVKEDYYTGSGTKFKSYSPYKNTSSNPSQLKVGQSIDFSKQMMGYNSTPNSISSSFENKIDDNTFFDNKNDLSYTSLGRIVGQAFNSYIIVEKEDKLYIYDQHALAERVIYEKLLKNHKFHTQKLLIPENIKLDSIELETLSQEEEHLINLGFEFELLGNNILSISQIPDFVKKEDLQKVIKEILIDMSKSSYSKKSIEEERNKIIAYRACRSAIKFGNKLNLFEMNKLLQEAYNIYASTCPHGRPVVFDIDIFDLKDKYER